jgi:hypothetical protein
MEVGMDTEVKAAIIKAASDMAIFLVHEPKGTSQKSARTLLSEEFDWAYSIIYNHTLRDPEPLPQNRDKL